MYDSSGASDRCQPTSLSCMSVPADGRASSSTKYQPCWSQCQAQATPCAEGGEDGAGAVAVGAAAAEAEAEVAATSLHAQPLTALAPQRRPRLRGCTLLGPLQLLLGATAAQLLT